MMGAAMLRHHQFVWSLWALYRLVVSSITWGSQVQPLLENKNLQILVALATCVLNREYVMTHCTCGHTVP